MSTSIDITFRHYNIPPTEHLHFRVMTRVFQVYLLWRTKECAAIRIFSSQLLPARIYIYDQNQEAEIFKFRWWRQSEFKNQLNLTSKMLTRMLHITNINIFQSLAIQTSFCPYKTDIMLYVHTNFIIQCLIIKNEFTNLWMSGCSCNLFAGFLTMIFKLMASGWCRL